jgi:hypothetical protein
LRRRKPIPPQLLLQVMTQHRRCPRQIEPKLLFPARERLPLLDLVPKSRTHAGTITGRSYSREQAALISEPSRAISVPLFLAIHDHARVRPCAPSPNPVASRHHCPSHNTGRAPAVLHPSGPFQIAWFGPSHSENPPDTRLWPAFHIHFQDIFWFRPNFPAPRLYWSQ